MKIIMQWFLHNSIWNDMLPIRKTIYWWTIDKIVLWKIFLIIKKDSSMNLLVHHINLSLDCRTIMKKKHQEIKEYSFLRFFSLWNLVSLNQKVELWYHQYEWLYMTNKHSDKHRLTFLRQKKCKKKR